MMSELKQTQVPPMDYDDILYDRALFKIRIPVPELTNVRNDDDDDDDDDDEEARLYYRETLTRYPLGYRPTSPTYLPVSPLYDSKDKMQHSNEPNLHLESPKYSPRSPSYLPVSPLYDSKDEMHYSNEPNLHLESPKYSPRSPSYLPVSPLYDLDPPSPKIVDSSSLASQSALAEEVEVEARPSKEKKKRAIIVPKILPVRKRQITDCP